MIGFVQLHHLSSCGGIPVLVPYSGMFAQKNKKMELESI